MIHNDIVSGWSATLLDIQLSPTKALRAAKLKSRFAATILKAQQKTLLDHVWILLVVDDAVKCINRCFIHAFL